MMGITIEPYTQELVDAVKQFNTRLLVGGVQEEFRFPESHVPFWLPKVNHAPIYQEYFLAVENRSVRGGYILKHQNFSFLGEVESIAHYQAPISEGIVDKGYATVGAKMLLNALRAHPMMFALGMGGWEQPLPRMLAAMGWSLSVVPFYFRVCNPQRFFLNLQVLRRSRWKRLLMNLAAMSGTGWAVVRGLQAFNGKPVSAGGRCAFEVVENFSDWADTVWDQCKEWYTMVAVRDAATLNTLYPAANLRFLRLRIRPQDSPIGWAVMLDTQMQGDRYFGDMRVGSIVDCLARPDDAPLVIREATRFLEQRGVDLIVCNQLHSRWDAALGKSGFLRGPSNFLFGASRKLSERLAPFVEKKSGIHLNRGDGDGPIHL